MPFSAAGRPFKSERRNPLAVSLAKLSLWRGQLMLRASHDAARSARDPGEPPNTERVRRVSEDVPAQVVMKQEPLPLELGSSLGYKTASM
jgi:hypothetical protein